MKLSVFPSSMETARSLIFHLVDIMNAEPDKTFNIAVSGGCLIYGQMNTLISLLGGV